MKEPRHSGRGQSRSAWVALIALASAPALGHASGTPPTPREPKSSTATEAPASRPSQNPAVHAGPVREEAEAHYRKGYEEVERAKQDVEKGKLDAAKKRFGKALKKFEYATELDPNYHEAWNMVGYCARQGGDLKRAFAAYFRCIALDPEYAEAHEYLGEAYLMSGELAKAKEQLAWLRSRKSEEADELAAKIDAATKDAAPAGEGHEKEREKEKVDGGGGAPAGQ